MNKIIALILSGVLVIIAISGCSQNKTLKIGLVGTLSGPSRGISESARRGLYIAVDEINGNGGIKGKTVEIVEKNDLNDAQIAKETAQQFIDENIQVVMGHFSSSMMASVLDIINEADILYCSPIVNASVFSKADDNLIQFNSDATFQSNLIYKMAAENGDNSFAFVYDTNNETYANSLLEALNDNIKTSGGTIEGEIPFNSFEVDFSDGVTKEIIKISPEADAIFISASGSAAALIITKLRLAGVTSNIYIGAWANSPDFKEIGGTFVEGVFMISPVDSEGQQPGFLSFREKYILLYGTEPDMGAVFAYDTMKTIENAILSANKYTADKIKEELLATGIIIGLQGNHGLDEFGDTDREYFPMAIIDGEMVKLNP